MNNINNIPADLGRIVEALALAVQLRIQGRLHEALACIDGLLLALPNFSPALLNRATTLAALGRYEEALGDCKRYMEYAPVTPEIIAFRDDIADTAIAAYRSESAADAGMHLRCGNIYLLTADYASAAQQYHALLAIAPVDRDGLCNLGYALVALGQPQDALPVYDQLLAADARNSATHYNRANVLREMGLLEAAVAGYRAAVAIDPDFAEAWLEIGHSLMLAGDFEAGWPLLEWRWKTAQLRHRMLSSAAPAWCGDTPLQDKTILLWAEQGLGDTLQFARFIPLLADRAGEVIVRGPATLLPLLAGIDPRIDLIEDTAALPWHDCHLPIMSLPLALGLTSSIPAVCPYLTAAPEKIAQWAAYMGPRSRLRIGVVWNGRQFGALNRTRDMPLTALLPLAALDADFICLQRDIGADDAAALAGDGQWRTPGLLLEDFSDTAALVMQLDLVVTVDTAVAHLAGALGKPCCLILRKSSEWRWQLARDDSPWYPSLRIFRQEQAGSWDAPVARLCAQLRDGYSPASFCGHPQDAA